MAELPDDCDSELADETELCDEFDGEDAEDAEEGGVAEEAELPLDDGSGVPDDDDDDIGCSLRRHYAEKKLALSIPLRAGSVILLQSRSSTNCLCEFRLVFTPNQLIGHAKTCRRL